MSWLVPNRVLDPVNNPRDRRRLTLILWVWRIQDALLPLGWWVVGVAVAYWAVRSFSRFSH
jgi:hypothetical protein